MNEYIDATCVVAKAPPLKNIVRFAVARRWYEAVNNSP
jgi:hypothetical protein